MNIHVSGHHLDVTAGMRSHIEGKLARISRHFEKVIDVNVILSTEKLSKKAEVTVHVSGKDIHVESQDADLYAAIDALVDKLDRRIIRHKESVRAHPHDALKYRAQEED